MRKMPEVEFDCERCGKHMSISRQFYGPRVGRFCSMECTWASHQYSDNPNWRGGTSLANGYKFVRLSPGERAVHTCRIRNNSYIPEHRLRAEKALGRCLRKSEAVHHINGNKLDNRNTNLLVCSNAYHAYLHAEMSRRFMRDNFESAPEAA